jgi:tetratricopeptide (TPR) repeat protein
VVEPTEEVIQYVPIDEAPVEPALDTMDASFLEQGLAVFWEGRYEEAQRLFVRALLTGQDEAAAEVAYSFVHFALQDYDVAGMALRRAITLEPELLDAPPDIRNLYGNPADFAVHMASLRDYVAGSLGERTSVFLLAYLEYATGAPDAALTLLDQLRAEDKGDTYVHLLRDAITRAAAVDGV